jgi:hypothetical protein
MDEWEVMTLSPQKQQPTATNFPIFYGWLQKKDDKSLFPTWKKNFYLLTSDGTLAAYAVCLHLPSLTS